MLGSWWRLLWFTVKLGLWLQTDSPSLLYLHCECSGVSLRTLFGNNTHTHNSTQKHNKSKKQKTHKKNAEPHWDSKKSNVCIFLSLLSCFCWLLPLSFVHFSVRWSVTVGVALKYICRARWCWLWTNEERAGPQHTTAERREFNTNHSQVNKRRLY